MEADNSQILVKEKYSEKSFALYGATKNHRVALKNLGGRYNKFLDIEGEKKPGWIFPLTKAEEIMDFVQRVNSGEKVSVEAIPNSDNNTSDLPTVAVPNSNNGSFQFVKFKIYKPSLGQKVILKADGKTTEGKVIKIETHNDIVDTVYVDFNGSTSLAMICGQEWRVFGYQIRHSLFFSN